MFFLILVVFLLIGGVLTVIAVQNLTLLVHLSLFSWQTPDLPVGMWLIATFLLGAIVLYLASVFSALGDRRELKALRQRVATLEGQITATDVANLSAVGQMASDRLSTANTGPLIPVSGSGVNTSQNGARIPTSPLAPMQKFRQ